MSDALSKARQALGRLDAELVEEMLRHGRLAQVQAGAELLREGAYVRELPLVAEGLVRVYIGHDDKELLLYYMKPAESCVMSFSAILEHAPSRINAVAEQRCLLLLLPEARLHGWLRAHVSLSALFLRQYNDRYVDMLRTVEQVAFGDLPSRLMDHLRRLAAMTGAAVLDVRHAKLALELGSAREVVTRALRKLERDGAIRQEAGGIRLLR
jgi:CRP/FNR family transcriptional regulator